jgi:anoctamin-10
MMVTFGYVTLFAAAFPLASFISVIMIYFEARSDLFKLEKLVRRPRAIKTYSIGSWIYVLEFMAVTSIFTNIILFTYASDQIEHLLPFMRRSKTGEVLAIFTIEHIMVAIVVLLRIFLDKDPKWVSLFKKRKAFKKEQKSLKTLYRARTAQF